jgi:hemerythrin-like metal-binding protein
MERIEWTAALEVGVAIVDEQHKRLVEMLNTLGKAIDENRGRDVIMGIVEEMKQYAQSHFQTEEEAMEATDYPKRSPHKQEHDSFIEEVLDAADALESGGKITPQEVWAFLRNWLTDHIQGSDKAFGPHLNAHGMH